MDPGPVGPLVDDAAGIVAAVPHVRHEATALRTVAGELAHDVASRVDDLDADTIGSAQAEPDVGRSGAAVAGRREDLRHRRADDRAARELELLGDDEGGRRRGEKRSDEERRCDPRAHRASGEVAEPRRARPGRDTSS